MPLAAPFSVPSVLHYPYSGFPLPRVHHGRGAFFRHRDWSGATIPELCRMLDAYLRYCNEERSKEKLDRTNPMQYRRNLGLAA